MSPRKASTKGTAANHHEAYHDPYAANFDEDEVEVEKTKDFLDNLRSADTQHQQQAKDHERQQREPLKDIDVEWQEALIIEDLLFVLMGIEGNFIEFDSNYSPDDPFERLQGARFVIDSHLGVYMFVFPLP